MSESVFKELCSSQKLERDRGYHSLVTYLQSLDEEGIYNLQFDLLKLLNNVDSSWETKHGALMGTKAVLENGNVSDDFEIEVKKKVMEFLDDNEFRVRIAAGKLSIVQESFEAMPGGGNKTLRHPQSQKTFHFSVPRHFGNPRQISQNREDI